MALSSEDDTTYLASPSKKKNVPVVAHVGNLIDIDPRSELIFETPPPDVVNSINKCFEQFTSTLEKKNDASVHQLSSDSDSGGSLFITQSVTKAVRTERRHRSSKRPESISDDSGNERDNGDTENERGSTSQHAECPFRRKIISHPAPRKAVFPFLLKSLGRQHLSLKKHQILENSEMGGFLKCIKKIEEGYVNTGRAISPSMPESDLSDLSEGDDHDSDHEVTKVMRLQDSLSNDNEQQSVDTNRKAKQSKTKSTEKNKTSASVKKQSKKKNEASKNKAVVRTSSESSIDSLFKEQEKQHETQEVLAACSDAEHSDSAHCRQRLTKQIVQCTENLHGDHLVVIEETQRNSVELITETAVHIEHEDDTSTPSQADDIMWPENAVSGVQPSSQQKKKKKHKLKDQQEAEPGADAHSADNVHSVEMSQFNDSHTTELTPERTKKKREDRERTKTTHVEDDSGTDIQSNEAFEAPETKRPEHIQSSEEITSPVARLKSGKKNGSEESVDFALDVSSVSQFDNVADRSIQDTVEERQSDDVEHTEAELNEAEHSGSVQRADNLHEDDLAVTEERQRNSVEAVTEPAVEHESDVRSDNYLPNKSNSMSPPQGGDISTQNVNQQTDSDFGSEDLFRPLNSQKHKTNQIHKGASVKINMEDSDQDSDVTQIETEGPFESIFGQGTPRWCDAGIDACEDNDGDETQIENEGQSVSVLGTGTPNKQFTESQKTDQSPLGLNAELLSKRDEKVKSNNKKTKKTMSSSEKDSEDTDVEKTLIVQPSFKHLPPSEPLKFCQVPVRNILGKRRARAEMETDLSESPLFRNGGLSFIKRKRNRKDKTGATASADVSSESPVDDITGDKITPRENRKSREVKNSVTNEEQTEASILHLEDTDLLEESISSTVADNSVITKVKKKKKKKYKSNENEDAEPSVENQSAETAKFNESQTTELISKVSKKKKRKDKERTKIAYADENNAADIPSSETLDSDRPAELRVNELNHFSEAPETDQPDHTETSEEITGCPLPTLKSVKKKKKKKEKR
ncbi:LOW QUALITY PROTEIN: uncharacterized protein LOC127164834 [Labeo rohita]|uniref:LOW QUALITY PROTEIN: uncharacterized protein LOC127164834 n=1 Tax=Labeo rohita TaxID=84645 RepID=UPI0021E257E1|nr:LOW QUALITY PROTEIN: uncharacterized protein LOC127164834 [Labeo rohita]